MRKRTIATALAIMLIIAMLVGCSQDEAAEREGATDTSEANTQSAAPDATREDTADAEDIVVTAGSGSKTDPADKKNEGGGLNVDDLQRMQQSANAQGLLNALTSTAGQSGIRNETSIALSFSRGAPFMTFAGFANAAIEGDIQLYDYAIGLTIISEEYEGIEKLTIGWMGEGGSSETIMTITNSEGMLYIGLEMFNFIAGIDGLAELADLLPLFSFSHIAVSTEELIALMGAGEDISMMDGLAEINPMQPSIEEFEGLMRAFAAEALTSDVLTKNGDTYTLTVNSELLPGLIGRILGFLADNEYSVKMALTDIIIAISMFSDIDVDEAIREVYAVNFKELAGEYEAAQINTEDVPDFELILTASGSGNDTDARQSVFMSFYLSGLLDIDPEAQFDYIALEISSISEASFEPIDIPPEAGVIALSELIALFEMLEAAAQQ